MEMPCFSGHFCFQYEAGELKSVHSIFLLATVKKLVRKHLSNIDSNQLLFIKTNNYE